MLTYISWGFSVHLGVFRGTFAVSVQVRAFISILSRKKYRLATLNCTWGRSLRWHRTRCRSHRCRRTRCRSHRCHRTRGRSLRWQNTLEVWLVELPRLETSYYWNCLHAPNSFFTGLVPATLSVDVVPHHGVICQFTKLFEKGYFNCCKIEILVKTALKDWTFFLDFWNELTNWRQQFICLHL